MEIKGERLEGRDRGQKERQHERRRGVETKEGKGE